MLKLCSVSILKKTKYISPLLVLDFGLDIVDSVWGLNLEGDGFARKASRRNESQQWRKREQVGISRFYENLHFDADASVCPTM